MISRLLSADFPKERWSTDLLRKINEIIDWVRRVEGNIPDVPDVPTLEETTAAAEAAILPQIPTAATDSSAGTVSGEDSFDLTSGVSWGGFSATPSSYRLRGYRVGKLAVIQVTWAQTSKNGSAGTVSLNGIPAGFRPAADVWGVNILAAGGAFASRACRLNTTGGLTWYASAAVNNFSASTGGIGPNGGEYVTIAYLVP